MVVLVLAGVAVLPCGSRRALSGITCSGARAGPALTSAVAMAVCRAGRAAIVVIASSHQWRPEPLVSFGHSGIEGSASIARYSDGRCA